MAEEGAKKPRSNPKQWTQFDIELIGAARDGKLVEFFFSLDSIEDNSPEFVGNILQVDKFMLKVVDPNMLPIWIQKHLLAGARVIAS